MADGVWKGVYPKFLGVLKQLSLNKFFDLKIMMKIVATTSLPAVDCLNAERWNAARLCQYYWKVMLCVLSKCVPIFLLLEYS